MDTQSINAFLMQYGLLAIFIIVFLEYLSLPGFPAGIIMPMAGLWAAQGRLGFILVLLVSVAAGMLGSMILYFLGRLGGALFLEKLLTRYPKHREKVDGMLERIRTRGYKGLFFAKLIPAIRTLVSIPAGVLGMNLGGYTLYSLAGILVWNTVFVGAGYFFGELIL